MRAQPGKAQIHLHNYPCYQARTLSRPVRPPTGRAPGGALLTCFAVPADGDRSLGDLAALAAKDVSQLIRYEIDLAKTELRGDMRRVGLAGAPAGVAAFVGCLVLVLCCFALAFGLVALLRLRHLPGLRRTRKSATEGFGMLRRDGQPSPVSPDGQRPTFSPDGAGPRPGDADRIGRPSALEYHRWLARSALRPDGPPLRPDRRRRALPARGTPGGRLTGGQRTWGGKGGGARRGGERAPRARSGPGGGGRSRPIKEAYLHWGSRIDPHAASATPIGP